MSNKQIGHCFTEVFHELSQHINNVFASFVYLLYNKPIIIWLFNVLKPVKDELNY